MNAPLDLRLLPGSGGSTKGDLRTLGLAEVAQLISLGAKTARVALRGRNESGKIWFDAGTVTHAECSGGMSGTPAFYRMLGWKEGDFVIEYDVTTEKRSLEGDIMYHVLEGLRRADEAAEPAGDPAPASAAEPVRRGSRSPVLALIPALAVVVGLVAWWTADPSPNLEAAAPVPGTSHAGPAIDMPPAKVRPAKSNRKSTRPPAKSTATKQKPTEDAALSSHPSAGTHDEATQATSAESLDFTPSPGSFMLDARPLQALAEPAEPSGTSLGISVRSKLDTGTLSVLVDGQVVYSTPLTRTAGAMRRIFQDRGESDEGRFNTQLHLSPGPHRLAARLQLEDGSEVQTADISVDGQSGDAQQLSIVAGAKRAQPIAIELKSP